MDIAITSTDFSAIFDHTLSPVVVFDTTFKVVACNQAYEKMLNTKRSTIIGHYLTDVLSSGNDQQDQDLIDSFNSVIASKQPVRIPFIRYDIPNATVVNDNKSDERYWAVVNTPILDEHGAVKYILNQPTDITELVQAREKQELIPLSGATDASQFELGLSFLDLLYKERARVHELFQQAPGFVCILTGKNYTFEMANKAYVDLFAHNKNIIGKPLAEAMPEAVEQGISVLLDEVCATGKPFFARAMEYQVYPDGPDNPKTIYIDFIYQPIRDANDEISGVFVQGYDVTEAHNLNQKVSYQATHDPLTGLYNRREIDHRSQQLQSQPGPHALIYIDLDHFKIVNDRSGHHAGDELLLQVADALKQVTDNGLLARIGGDEFIFLLENCSLTKAKTLARRAARHINDIAFYWQKSRYSITASMGIAEFGSAIDTSYTDALSLADSACFLAKDKGRDRIQVNHPDDADMHQQHKDMDWATRLKEAMREDRIVLYAQNIIKLSRVDQVHHKEILSRLVDKDGTIVPPGAFITAAERYGLIEQLDRHIIRKVFQSIVQLQENQQTVPHFFINVSGISLSNPSFKGFIEALLREFMHVDGTKICFEITETAAVANLNRTAKMMNHINKLGIKFALDDFGSGVATFDYLDKLPITYIKIDGAFVTDLKTRPIGEAIVQSIQNIAQIMGVKTIAECIEDVELIPHLRKLGINYGQGYGIHRPEPLL